MSIDSAIISMHAMSIDRLRNKYVETFGESTSSRHKAWLIKRIAWRLQANSEGGLTERARRRARELANHADLRLSHPNEPKARAVSKTAKIPAKIEHRNQLHTGLVLTRLYKGQEIRVTVSDGEFEYDGEIYKSLTAVAKKVTGKHWNGFNFFKLRGGDKA